MTCMSVEKGVPTKTSGPLGKKTTCLKQFLIFFFLLLEDITDRKFLNWHPVYMYI